MWKINSTQHSANGTWWHPVDTDTTPDGYADPLEQPIRANQYYRHSAKWRGEKWCDGTAVSDPSVVVRRCVSCLSLKFLFVSFITLVFASLILSWYWLGRCLLPAFAERQQRTSRPNLFRREFIRINVWGCSSRTYGGIKIWIKCSFRP